MVVVADQFKLALAITDIQRVRVGAITGQRNRAAPPNGTKDECDK